MTASSSERRSAILKAAARLFEHHGYGKTTIADVAREAHVGVGTVYLEFESKEAIVQELSLSTHVGVLEAMRIASRKETDHGARLTAALLARTRSFLELRKKGQHTCELLHYKTEGVRTAQHRFEEQERELFAELLEEGQRAGTFTTSAPAATAALIQRAFATLSPPWIFGSNGDETRVASDLCELLLRGLLRESADAPAGPSSRAGKLERESDRKPTRTR
jgi:AcrR family transcriptional regulator